MPDFLDTVSASTPNLAPYDFLRLLLSVAKSTTYGQPPGTVVPQMQAFSHVNALAAERLVRIQSFWAMVAGRKLRRSRPVLHK